MPSGADLAVFLWNRDTVVGIISETIPERWISSLFAAVALMAVLWPGLALARDVNILVLHSYHADYAWTQNQHAGFITTLEQAAPQHRIACSVEYLDTKRKDYSPAYESVFAEYLREKFRDFLPDAIYVTDDHALTFMRHHRARLFPRTPVIFSGINDLWLQTQLDPRFFMGVYERKDVAGNVRLALQMDPALQTLYFVGDGSTSHDLVARHVSEEMAHHFPDLAFEFVTDKNLAGLQRSLAARGAGTVVLTTLGGLQGAGGGAVPIPLAIRALEEAGEFKILSMGANYLTDGVIGGCVLEGVAQGQGAARVLADKVLGLPAVGTEQEVDPNRARLVFQYPLLERWNIPMSALPAGSTILGAPAQDMGADPRFVLGGLLFLALQSLVLIFLLPRLRSLSMVRQALKGSEKRFDVVARVINDALVGVNDRGLVVIFNPAAQRMFGFAEKEMLGRPLDVLIPLRYRDRHRRSLQDFFSGAPMSDMLGMNLELPALRSSGEEFFVELSLSLWQQGQTSRVIAALRDVTARRRADEELRRSEERYRALVQTQVEAVCRWLPDTTLTYVNQAFCRLLGKRPEELLGRKFIDLLPVEARGRMDEHIRELLANPGTLYEEIPIPNRDGGSLWYRWSNTAIVGELGDVMEVQSVGLDITERKRVEEDLRESESRFRDTADLLPQAVFETDALGTLAFANRVTMEMTGCGGADLERGVTIFDLVAESDCQQLAQTFHRVLDGETIHAREALIEMRNGRRIEVLISAAPLVRKGRVVGVRGVAVDISERIVAEQALRQSEKKFKRLFREYQTLLDGIPDPIALIAPDLTVLRTNLATADIVARPVQELPGQKCCSLWADSSCRQEECPVMTSFRTGVVRKMVARTDDGRSWEVRTFPVKNKTGTTVQVIRYANDITRQMQLREESLRTGQLASLGELAAGVAHEINNPINGIINYAQLLADSLDIEQEDMDILCGIIDEGERIANIVRNLLAFARARKEHKDRVALSDMLACSLALTESQLRKDGIRLQVEVPDGLPEVIAHAQEIQQVILNLLSNSRYALNKKYPSVDEQKTLTIKAEAADHRGVPSLKLTVCDQGPGIPQKALHKVLEPFYTTKPTGEGTGLGLSISHGIIKDHQGEMIIGSKEGQYTSVTLVLPAAPEESHEHS